MKISSSNRNGLAILEANLLNFTAKKLVKEIEKKDPVVNNKGDKAVFFFTGFKSEKVIKITKKLYEESTLIDFDSLNENFELETSAKDFVILYHIDKLAYVRKMGKEIAFFVVDCIDPRNIEPYIGNYNFISQSFYPTYTRDEGIELIKILVYLFYGEIETKVIDPNSKLKKSFSFHVYNDSKVKIHYANSLWKMRINVTGFKVSGHFRLQACGVNYSKRKLIWIDQYAKSGYRRKATREIYEK